MMLSILIPSIPERLPQLASRMETYESFIKLYSLQGLIEVIAIVDNKQRTIGEKRNDLLRLANGDYIVFSDDDDWLTQTYFKLIINGCEKRVDVITYLQSARINEDLTTVQFGLKQENQEFQKNGITIRPAWHCCTWRREKVKNILFPAINYGEDDPWAKAANEKAETSYHINEVCHVYTHDSTKTASFDERGN